MQDNEFEWNDDKAVRNFAEHGVSFELARSVFDDPFAFDLEDFREDYGEDRFNKIGMTADRLPHVTYTHRGERVRIIELPPAGQLPTWLRA